MQLNTTSTPPKKIRKNNFYARVAMLAATAIKHSRSPVERQEAQDVLDLMQKKQTRAA